MRALTWCRSWSSGIAGVADRLSNKRRFEFRLGQTKCSIVTGDTNHQSVWKKDLANSVSFLYVSSAFFKYQLDTVSKIPWCSHAFSGQFQYGNTEWYLLTFENSVRFRGRWKHRKAGIFYIWFVVRIKWSSTYVYGWLQWIKQSSSDYFRVAGLI